MMLIAAALAPSESRNWPLMLAPPSYVVSPNRFTMPSVNTKAKAALAATRRVSMPLAFRAETALMSHYLASLSGGDRGIIPAWVWQAHRLCAARHRHADRPGESDGRYATRVHT